MRPEKLGSKWAEVNREAVAFDTWQLPFLPTEARGPTRGSSEDVTAIAYRSGGYRLRSWINTRPFSSACAFWLLKLS